MIFIFNFICIEKSRKNYNEDKKHFGWTDAGVDMAAILGSPSLLSHQLSKLHLSASSSPSSPTPPTPPPSQTQSMQPPPKITPKPPTAPTLGNAQVTPKPKPATTDWIASTLTRRFGLGAGLAWAGFLAAGVVSEQIKSRLEVFQQQSNTKYFCLDFPFSPPCKPCPAM